MIYQVSGNAPSMYPVELFFGLLFITEDKAKDIPYSFPIRGNWGEPVSDVFEEPEDVDLPHRVDLVYYSIVEQRFYSIESDLPTDKMMSIHSTTSSESDRMRIVVGLAPYGHIALWLYYDRCSRLITTLKGEETQVASEQFRPLAPHITPEIISKEYFDLLPEVQANLVNNGLPDEELFNQLMAQYCYRVVPLFEVWDEDKEQWEKHEPDDSDIPMFDYVEMSCTDGTFDKLHYDYLISHHTSGTPKRMNLLWHVKKSDWMMYVWFDAQVLSPMLKRFYGAHRDTRVDLLVHCDPEKRHYELALYRYGMQQPHLLPEESYQLIVFKNQFEHYRSANYAQPNGAWVW